MATQHPTSPPHARGRTLDLLPEIESVGRRLASELRSTLEALGWPACSVRSLARTLDLDPNICQRVASAARCTDSPLEAIQRTPGLEGLDQFRRACARHEVDRTLLAALASAIAQLEHLMERHGGGLARLRSVLADSAPTSQGTSTASDGFRHRRDAFLAMAACCGSRLDAQAVSVFLRADHGGAGLLDGFFINAYFGWQSRPGGLPLLLSTFGDAGANPDAQTHAHETRPRAFILDKYSTQPTPLVSAHSAAPGVSMHMLDPAWQPPRTQRDLGSPETPGADVVVVNTIDSTTDPRRTTPRIHNNFVRCRYPARELLLDVFLSRELAAASVPTAGIFWSSKWLTDGLPARWHDRLPGPASVVVFPASALDNPLRRSPRHAEMVREVASDMGWPLDDLVVHRLHVRYPLWGAAHVISFDFEGAPAGGESASAGTH